MQLNPLAPEKCIIVKAKPTKSPKSVLIIQILVINFTTYLTICAHIGVLNVPKRLGSPL